MALAGRGGEFGDLPAEQGGLRMGGEVGALVGEAGGGGDVVGVHAEYPFVPRVLHAVVEGTPEPDVFGQPDDVERQSVGEFGEHRF